MAVRFQKALAGGRVLVPDGDLPTIDVPTVVGATGELMPGFVDRSHGRRIQDCNS